jgi:hypothetical protein
MTDRIQVSPSIRTAHLRHNSQRDDLPRRVWRAKINLAFVPEQIRKMLADEDWGSYQPGVDRLLQSLSELRAALSELEESVGVSLSESLS